MTERIERTEDLYLIDMGTALPAEEGQIRQANGDILAFIGGSVKSLTAGSGGGITENQHELLDTLTHEIDETSYDEVTYSSGRATSYIVWATSAKLLKIREELYSYQSGKVSQVISKQYDGAGALKMTVTEDYTYAGSNVASVTRTKT
jgi:hypothetical protein